MVHALEESRRVLKNGSALIDLRPITEAWPIEVVTARQAQLVSRVTPVPDDVELDKAADRSFRDAEKAGMFVRETGSSFTYDYYWDSPAEMKEYVETEWDDWVTISRQAWSQIRPAWAVADADARLRVSVKMQLTRWKKT